MAREYRHDIVTDSAEIRKFIYTRINETGYDVEKIAEAVGLTKKQLTHYLNAGTENSAFESRKSVFHEHIKKLCAIVGAELRVSVIVSMSLDDANKLYQEYSASFVFEKSEMLSFEDFLKLRKYKIFVPNNKLML